MSINNAHHLEFIREFKITPVATATLSESNPFGSVLVECIVIPAVQNFFNSYDNPQPSFPKNTFTV